MTIKIYKPSKTSMQSGFKKTKLWLAEYISEVEKVKDSLMGWNSSLDTKSQIKLFFDTKEQAIEWAKKIIINILSKNQSKEKLNQKVMLQILIQIEKSLGHIKYNFFPYFLDYDKCKLCARSSVDRATAF